MFGAMNQTDVLSFPLSRRLKSATTDAHEALDTRIMAAQPFASIERYSRFLRMQHGFHRDIAAVYEDPRLLALLPDLASRCRLRDIEADLGDLDLQTTVITAPEGPGSSFAERLGWLYVAEGSNLGAAFLIKEAAKLGLGAERGARHLSAHPEGRGLQWRRFQEAVDGAGLDDRAEAEAVAGANAAFRRVRTLTDHAFTD